MIRAIINENDPNRRRPLREWLWEHEQRKAREKRKCIMSGIISYNWLASGLLADRKSQRKLITAQKPKRAGKSLVMLRL